MLSLNVYTDNWCEGCKFHTYPYEASPPLRNRSNKVFRSDKDVWDVIELLVAETREINEKMGKDFDIAGSVSYQVPFFSCMNIVLSKDAQKDISKYLYCKEFASVAPYKGSYGEQPYKWIKKINVIQSAINKREAKQYRKMEKEAKMKSGATNG